MSRTLQPPGPSAAALVVEPDAEVAEALGAAITAAGLAGRLDVEATMGAALDALASGPYVLVLVSLSATGGAALEELDRIRAIDPEVPVVVVSEGDEPELARVAIQKGAQDCVPRAELTGSAAARILGHAVERQRIMLQLHEAREREQYLATHDPLTGVPNRTLFYDRLAQALASAARYDQGLAILFLDLDDFKEINDALGHEAGDRMLHEMARRIAGQVRKSDTVARIGGDEFTVILSQLGKPEDAARVARAMLERIAMPMRLEGGEHRVHASIGIAVHPADGERADTLVRNADTAMYAAKKAGGNRFAFYDRRMRREDASPGRGGAPPTN